MIQHLVHLRAPNSKPGESLTWEESLAQRGFVLLRAYTTKQAQFMAKSNPLIAILVDIEDNGARPVGRVRELTQLETQGPVALVGMAQTDLAPQTKVELAWAGLDVLLPQEFPLEFLVYQLKLHQAIIDLKSLGAPGSDVRAVSEETRKRMHDLSQPLTALQGRLQIMEADLKDGPQKTTLQDLIKLTFKVSEQLNDLHEYHRKFR